MAEESFIGGFTGSLIAYLLLPPRQVVVERQRHGIPALTDVVRVSVVPYSRFSAARMQVPARSVSRVEYHGSVNGVTVIYPMQCLTEGGLVDQSSLMPIQMCGDTCGVTLPVGSVVALSISNPSIIRFHNPNDSAVWIEMVYHI